jgi:hypothetical protein
MWRGSAPTTASDTGTIWVFDLDCPRHLTYLQVEPLTCLQWADAGIAVGGPHGAGVFDSPAPRFSGVLHLIPSATSATGTLPDVASSGGHGRKPRAVAGSGRVRQWATSPGTGPPPQAALDLIEPNSIS